MNQILNIYLGGFVLKNTTHTHMVYNILYFLKNFLKFKELKDIYEVFLYSRLYIGEVLHDGNDHG